MHHDLSAITRHPKYPPGVNWLPIAYTYPFYGHTLPIVAIVKKERGQWIAFKAANAFTKPSFSYSVPNVDICPTFNLLCHLLVAFCLMTLRSEKHGG